MTNISKILIDWYSQHKRDLPWRNTKDPYFIWISEIILQQTRIDQGLSYYYKFTETFPDIFSLAKADINQVLKIWQGLGYYSRARNMHYTANDIVENYKGQFPNNYDKLKKLKGIGDYTAAAIASICFNQSIPVLDGNVFRVLSRLFGIYESTQTLKGKKVFYKNALNIIDSSQPGDFNQAIMEFGSLQCTPQNPDCTMCGFNKICFAINNNEIEKLPIKKQKVKTRNRYFTYLYIIYNNNTFLSQRNKQDIWKHLFEFPLIETNNNLTTEELLVHPKWKKIFNNIDIKISGEIFEKKHVLSHQKIYARFIKVSVPNLNNYINSNYKLTPLKDIDKYGIPRLIERFLESVNK